ncbi:hypothetical protein [Clostridium sp.]|uniref:hypothetical protein n=1 Tax=Clostridium sp. TaxID=1506 RepID=UPI001A5DDA30|nr:hypothetical protein [Clostridium sp.]MBK5234045.1 hypothetical protein [Clostridium sp.]
MASAEFLKARISKQIKSRGSKFTFYIVEYDIYHKVITPATEVILSGIYHETSSYVTESVSDATKSYSKKIPMILCLTEDVGVISNDDYISINEIRYRVTGVTDINNLKAITDISLEVVQNV